MAVAASGRGRKESCVAEAVLEQCQELIGYRFGDLGLLSQALTHASVAPTRTASNERLEFLGDSVLALAVCQDLYQREGELGEGEMTKIKSAVVSRVTCAAIAEDLGLCRLLSLGKGMSKPGAMPLSVAAAVFEAVVGAIYLDGGYPPAREFILRHIGAYIDEALTTDHQKNYKSLLQQYAQREWTITPDYRLLDEKGPDHSKCFEVAVSMNGRQFPSAWGKSKKDAEQEAARRALVALKLIEEGD
jgi:ribonuclease-3